MDTFARKSSGVCGQSGYQGFAFAGLHLGNSSRIQNQSTRKLNIKMSLSESSDSNLAYHGECFWDYSAWNLGPLVRDLLNILLKSDMYWALYHTVGLSASREARRGLEASP